MSILEILLTPSNIMFVFGIFGIVFAIWGKITTPIYKSQKEDALFNQKMKFNEETNEAKFKEMAVRLDQAFSLAQNHIHTIDTKVGTLDISVRDMGLKIEKLSTIINERIPKK